jgi:hypothetical protein
MRLIELFESNQTVTAYHGGSRIDKFSFDHLGTGENNHLLGPGVYFATRKNIGKIYTKYSSDPHLTEVEIDMSRVYDPIKGLPESMRGLGDQMAQSLGYDTMDDLPFKHTSLKYGRWPIGPIVETIGVKKAHELFRKFRLDGMYEHLDTDSLEIAIYNMDVVKIIHSSPHDTTN